MTSPETLAAWGKVMVCGRTLRTVVETFERAGIPALPVKGVLLVHQLYDDPSERPLSDVDLLIRPRDFLRALRAATDAGFGHYWDSKTLGSVNFVAGRVPADTACTVGPPGTCAFGVEQMLARATRSVEPLGFPHWQIEWHDHALLMLIDTFKDKLVSKPAAREDLLRLTTRGPFEPQLMTQRIVEAKLSTAAVAVLDWLLASTPSTPWSEVRRGLLARGVRERYRRTYLESADAGAAARESFRLRLLTRAASDSPLRRIWAVSLGAVGLVAYHTHHRGTRAS